jgi:hypothetical protein
VAGQRWVGQGRIGSSEYRIKNTRSLLWQLLSGLPVCPPAWNFLIGSGPTPAGCRTNLACRTARATELFIHPSWRGACNGSKSPSPLIISQGFFLASWPSWLVLLIYGCCKSSKHGKDLFIFWFWGSAISLFHVLCPLRRILDTNVFVNFDDGLFFVMLLFWKWVYPKTGQLLAQDMDGWSYEVPKLRQVHALWEMLLKCK